MYRVHYVSLSDLLFLDSRLCMSLNFKLTRETPGEAEATVELLLVVTFLFKRSRVRDV